MVFAVWEPILPTDWSAPSTSALARLNDQRVRQFWDPNHMVAGVLQRAQDAGQFQPDCCVRKGILWDLTAAYAPGKQWPIGLSQPELFNGPVVRKTAELESLLDHGR
jgi:hypothetical protein